MPEIKAVSQQRDSSIYFSDVHLGAGRDNFDLVKRAFTAFPDFCEGEGFSVAEAYDLGDTTECWLPESKACRRNNYDVYQNLEVLVAMRRMYEGIFGERPARVHACAGNHQIQIHDKTSSKDALREEAAIAREKLGSFLQKVFSSRQAEFDVFDGMKKAEPGVIVHHGHLLNLRGSMDSLLDRLPSEESLDAQLSLINEDLDAHGEMHWMWNNFKDYLWPALDRLPNATDKTFRLLDKKMKVAALLREGRSSRSFAERWQNPFSNFAELQLKLMQALKLDHSDPLMVSGHTHLPNIISNLGPYSGTVVSLGAWKDTHYNPVVGMKTPERDRQLFTMAEFDPHASDEGSWFTRDQVEVLKA